MICPASLSFLQAETSGKGPGPRGTKTLCSVCSARYRSGHSGPPDQDEDGRFVCASCDRKFDTFAARGAHQPTTYQEVQLGLSAVEGRDSSRYEYWIVVEMVTWIMLLTTCPMS